MGSWSNIASLEAVDNRHSREDVRRMKDRLASKRANAGFVQDTLIAAHARRLALARDDLRHSPPLDTVRAVHVRDGLEQALSILIGNAGEDCVIGGDRLEQLDRLVQSCQQLTLIGRRAFRTHPISVPHDRQSGVRLSLLS